MTMIEVFDLTYEMRLPDHLQPNFVRPMFSRPARQQWSNWVKGWKPLSVEGKAAKRYSRVQPAPDFQQMRRRTREYERWLAERDGTIG